jgi:hypothetical protein
MFLKKKPLGVKSLITTLVPSSSTTKILGLVLDDSLNT